MLSMKPYNAEYFAGNFKAEIGFSYRFVFMDGSKKIWSLVADDRWSHFTVKFIMEKHSVASASSLS